MPEYVHLIGAEEVRNAGNQISSAADRMSRASSQIFEAVENFGRIAQSLEVALYGVAAGLTRLAEPFEKAASIEMPKEEG